MCNPNIYVGFRKCELQRRPEPCTSPRHERTCAWIYSCTHAYPFRYTCAHIMHTCCLRMHINTRTHAHVHAQTHKHTRTRAQTRAYTHTHTHTAVQTETISYKVTMKRQWMQLAGVIEPGVSCFGRRIENGYQRISNYNHPI